MSNLGSWIANKSVEIDFTTAVKSILNTKGSAAKSILLIIAASPKADQFGRITSSAISKLAKYFYNSDSSALVNPKLVLTFTLNWTHRLLQHQAQHQRGQLLCHHQFITTT